MRKILVFIAAALLIVGCAKKPAEQQETPQEQPIEEQVVDSTLYLDITGLTPNGEELSLSDLVGKTDFVLVDFWASWCWQVALNEEQMPWPQMREDADHICSDKYHVQFIPHTVLIDRDGHIVGVNLEEPEIEEILLGE